MAEKQRVATPSECSGGFCGFSRGGGEGGAEGTVKKGLFIVNGHFGFIGFSL